MLIILAAVAAGVGSTLLFTSAPRTEKLAAGEPVVATRKADKVAIPVSSHREEHAIRTNDAFREPPPNLLDLNADEESKLTVLERHLIDELQAAVDSDNFESVRAVLAKFKTPSSIGGLNGKVPSVLLSKAIEALGWFGSAALPELADIASGADAADDIDPEEREELSQEALEKMMEALDDIDCSDYEIADNLTAILQALTDADMCDEVLMHLDDMRNSVKAEAGIEILTSGTDVAKATLCEQFEDYFQFEDDGTHEPSVDTIQEWLNANPDDPDDGELYGGSWE